MPRKPKPTYDHHWRRIRAEILERDGYRCYFEGCGVRATTVDHIVPVSEAPSLRLDPANLRASCVPHNSGRVTPRMAAMAKMNRQPAEVREW